MARQIVWAEAAIQHLEEIAAYVALDSPQFSALTVSRIVARVEQAADFPESGRTLPEFGDPTLRELFWREYRVIYRVERERIIVVGVVHGRRRLTEALDLTS